jgi:hypothetical protein
MIHHTLCCPLAFYISYVCHSYLCYVFITSSRVSLLINTIWSLLCSSNSTSYHMLSPRLLYFLCLSLILMLCFHHVIESLTTYQHDLEPLVLLAHTTICYVFHHPLLYVMFFFFPFALYLCYECHI